MCGIVGFTGHQQAAPILLEGLSKLEYRGYDSAGLAVRDGENLAEVVKSTGKLRNLAEKTNDGLAIHGTCGIGHTRWATHGEPSQTNAHPHVSGNCTRSGSGPVESGVVGVHNGIIENYQELKDKLLRHGYTFYSQTDTEVLIKLVDYYYKKYQAGPIDAINKTLVRVRGSYALEVMFTDYPGEIFVARKDSPMIIGVAGGETYVASDVPAILKYTRNVFYIGNLQLARLRPGQAIFYDLNGDEIEIEPTEITFSAEAAEKGGYEHFMMKEIHEQPKAVLDTLNSVLKEDRIDLSEVGLTDEEIQNISQIYIVACGSAYHVGMAAQYIFEDLAELPVRVELASEFRYRRMPLDSNALVVVISQSGETADSLAALREAKTKGLKTMGIVNVVGSSIAREADRGRSGDRCGYHKGVFRSADRLRYIGGAVWKGQREADRGTVRRTDRQAAAPAGENEPAAGGKGADPVVCREVCQRKGCILCGPRNRLRHRAGGQPEDEGDQLHPFRGLCRRGAEARDD